MVWQHSWARSNLQFFVVVVDDARKDMFCHLARTHEISCRWHEFSYFSWRCCLLQSSWTKEVSLETRAFYRTRDVTFMSRDCLQIAHWIPLLRVLPPAVKREGHLSAESSRSSSFLSCASNHGHISSFILPFLILWWVKLIPKVVLRTQVPSVMTRWSISVRYLSKLLL